MQVGLGVSSLHGLSQITRISCSPGVAQMSAFLTRELRESSPYLADEGWHHVAKLMDAAADEIERLDARIHQLDTTVSSQDRNRK